MKYNLFVVGGRKMPKVDKDLCIGCGLCTGVAPGAFAFGDDGKAEVVGDDPAVEEAKESCPVGAISD